MTRLETQVTSLTEKFEVSVINSDNKFESNREFINDSLAENNEKLYEATNGMKTDLKSDMENILKTIEEDRENNRMKLDGMTTSLAILDDFMHNKLEENFNLLLSRMENDAKNNESLKDGQDVEMNALKEEVTAMIAR